MKTPGSSKIVPPPERLQVWLFVVAVLVAISTIAGLSLPAELKGPPGIAGAVLVLLAFALSWMKSTAESALRAEASKNEKAALNLAKAARERSAILFGYNLREVLVSIDGLAKQPPAARAGEAPAVRQSVAVQAKEGVGALAARAAYFRVADLSSEDRTMSPDKVASSPERLDVFTTRFDESGPLDQDVWRILDGRQPTAFVENTASWAAARSDPRQRVYGTFITARVEAGGIPFGLLTVNALAPGSLVQDDALFVEALARILGIVELLCMTTQAYTRASEATSTRLSRMSDDGGRLSAIDGGPENE